MDLEKKLIDIVEDLTINACPPEYYMYMPKETHKIIQKHLEEIITHYEKSKD